MRILRFLHRPEDSSSVISGLYLGQKESPLKMVMHHGDEILVKEENGCQFEKKDALKDDCSLFDILDGVLIAISNCRPKMSEEQIYLSGDDHQYHKD